MKYNEVAERIVCLIQTATSFAESGNQIQSHLVQCLRDDILDHLDYGGVIPERFGHDSTEEKVFAKYCDALLARALLELGLDAHVLDARADAADVHATLKGKYSLVGDAKAFRLSRTAKNQKDFKVEPLNQWRSGADYACLLAPLYQYPNTDSQIYKQAVRYNVTLLSYTHLAFIIRSNKIDPERLKELWESSKAIQETGNARIYWENIKKVMLNITGKVEDDWQIARDQTIERLKEQATVEIKFWEERKEYLKSLDPPTAIQELIKALKIDSKITVIRRTAAL